MRDPNHVHDPNLDPRTCYSRGCLRISCIDANAAYQREYRASASGVTRERQRRDSKKLKRTQDARDAAALFSE